MVKGFFQIICFTGLISIICCGCKEKISPEVTKEMEVTVTAYNSLPGQTTARDSDIAAWGDTLSPGMKSVAVSRDLMRLGLVHNSKVQIEGFEEDFLVLDKMNGRYKKRIDIYMGIDVKSAREWGRKKRIIYWKVARESEFDKRYQYEPDKDSLK